MKKEDHYKKPGFFYRRLLKEAGSMDSLDGKRGKEYGR
jgi:hypothetical protein